MRTQDCKAIRQLAAKYTSDSPLGPGDFDVKLKSHHFSYTGRTFPSPTGLPEGSGDDLPESSILRSSEKKFVSAMRTATGDELTNRKRKRQPHLSQDGG